MGTIVVPVFQVFSDGDPQLPLGSEDHLVQTPRLDGPDEILLAILFSFAATCKANGVNYRQWLEDILIRINTTPASQIDSLLPQNWDLQPTLKYPGKATQTRL